MTLRYLTAGESHGPGLVAIAEGFPAGLPVDFEAVNAELRRRQKGYGRGGRQKIETDAAQFLAGLRGAVDRRRAHRLRHLEQGPRELEGARLALRPRRPEVHAGPPRPRRPGRRAQVRPRRRPRRAGARQRPVHRGHGGPGRAGPRSSSAGSASRSPPGWSPSAPRSQAFDGPPERGAAGSHRGLRPPRGRRGAGGRVARPHRRREGARRLHRRRLRDLRHRPPHRPGEPTSTRTGGSTRGWRRRCAASRPSAAVEVGEGMRSTCPATSSTTPSTTTRSAASAARPTAPAAWREA